MKTLDSCTVRAQSVSLQDAATAYWQKERWSRRVADMLTSYGLCWNPRRGHRVPAPNGTNSTSGVASRARRYETATSCGMKEAQALGADMDNLFRLAVSPKDCHPTRGFSHPLDLQFKAPGSMAECCSQNTGVPPRVSDESETVAREE
jgi:hypothetical protein